MPGIKKPYLAKVVAEANSGEAGGALAPGRPASFAKQNERVYQ